MATRVDRRDFLRAALASVVALPMLSNMLGVAQVFEPDKKRAPAIMSLRSDVVRLVERQGDGYKVAHVIAKNNYRYSDGMETEDQVVSYVLRDVPVQSVLIPASLIFRIQNDGNNFRITVLAIADDEEFLFLKDVIVNADSMDDLIDKLFDFTVRESASRGMYRVQRVIKLINAVRS